MPDLNINVRVPAAHVARMAAQFRSGFGRIEIKEGDNTRPETDEETIKRVLGHWLSDYDAKRRRQDAIDSIQPDPQLVEIT